MIGLEPGVIHSFAPPPGSEIALLEASLVALLSGLELYEPDAPEARRYRASLRARGWEVIAAGGPDALGYLCHRVTEAEPALGVVRETILDLAWEGLPGWRP